MEKTSLNHRVDTFTWKEIDELENVYPGHLACQGCGASLAMRLVLKALGSNTVMTVPACCSTLIVGTFPYHSLKVPMFHTAFETAAITAAGIKAGLSVRGYPDTTVLAWGGDGGTFDIGFAALSGAAERNEDIIYVCYDNEAYMNTGIQRSSATPWGAWTTTTPERHPEDKPKKDIVGILAAHRVPYVATATLAYPQDLTRKVKKAKDLKGFRFIHLLAPCPPGWRMESELTILSSRLAVETRIFPLYEVENGKRYTLNYAPKGRPITDYLSTQGRFKHLTPEQIHYIQQCVDENWAEVMEKHRLTHRTTEGIPASGYQ